MSLPVPARSSSRRAVVGIGAALAVAALPSMASAGLISSPAGTKDLGNVEVGASVQVPFTLTNDAPLVQGSSLFNVLFIATAPTLGGPSASEFTIDQGTCTKDQALGDPSARNQATGQPLSYSCAGTVTFKAASPGAKTVSVTSAGGMLYPATTGGCTQVTDPGAGVWPFNCPNTFTITAKVGAPPLLAPTLSVRPTGVRNYRTVQATVTVRNSGDFPAVRARSCIQMPTGFVVVNRRGALRQGNKMCWNLGDLAGAATSTHSVVLRATSAKRRPTVRVFQARALFAGAPTVSAKRQRVVVSGSR